MADNEIGIDSKVILERWWESANAFLNSPMPKETDFEMLLDETKPGISLDSRIRAQQKMMIWLTVQMSQEIANINIQLQKLQNIQK